MTLFRFVYIATFLATGLSAADRVQFNRDIRPILSDNCFHCHGPDGANRKAKLRLDDRAAAIAKKAFVPGDAGASAVVERILADDADDLMPPLESHKKLSPQQKEIVKRWIDEGAEYQSHWAFVAPVKATLPTPASDSGAGNPIDAFIRVRLTEEGLTPSPEANRETLIRRVTLDLTGLPPTLEEVDAFLKDPSPDAYGKVVDRILASQHYGERMAIDWLDAARYADSNGYQVDRDRELWPWRDWVIRSFNANQPFDQFTIEQLAGDLLPGAKLEQKIATGFHRNHMLNEEGGVLADEFLAEYTADRVETTAAVWLGQTFNCNRCHDHKFDPFTQRDFYAMKAFFHNVPERGVGIYSSPIRINAPPFVKLPAPEIESKIAALNEKLKAANDQIAALAAQSSAGIEEWAGGLTTTLVKWDALELVSAEGGDAPPQLNTASRTLIVGPQETRANTIKIRATLPAGPVTALRLECATTDAAASFQWSDLKIVSKDALKLRAAAAGASLPANESVKVTDNDRKTRVAISVKPGTSIGAVFELERAIDGKEPTGIVIEVGVENAGGSSRWQVFSSSTESQWLAPAGIIAAAKKAAAQRSGAEVKQLREFRLSQLPEHRRLNDEEASLKKQVAAAEGEIPTTLVMEELPEPRATFVLMRGAYDRPGESVTAATPAILPSLEAGLPGNRLGLAKWLVNPANPLTSRVIVNRFWQQVFGTGLVETSEDFGSQGTPPSHPELLDWLAVTFRESGWDVKGLMRLMVTSATYLQQSHLAPQLLQLDPDNHLLARGARHRLMAEFVRDQALASSGLLVDRIGGPSVKPYHPAGIYEQITAGNGTNVYVPGKGDDLHRRSVYTYWKRSVPNPAMLLFDAPFREVCSLRRPRTNTPLQALNLMNDPTYVEAARFLAARMMIEGGETVDSRLTQGFRLLLVRHPGPEELAILRSAYERSRSDFEKDVEAAGQFLAIGEAGTEANLNVAELAAFTSVASTMLNLDETIMKE